MDNKNQNSLINLVDEKFPCQFKKGELIIEQGKRMGYIYFIEKGRVKLVHRNARGKEFTFFEIGSGEYLGIHPMINKESSFVSVIASETVFAYKISEEILNRAIKEKGMISLELIKHLCSKIGLIETKIAESVPKGIKRKLIRILLSKSEIKDKQNKAIVCSIQELASSIGTTKNYIYRILSEFEKLKILSIRDKKIELLDVQRLVTLEGD